jgi:coenzyme F420-reducing hydrogenase alpha subunit
MLEDGTMEWQGSLRATYNKYLAPQVLDYTSAEMWDMVGRGEISSLFQFDTLVGSQAIKSIQPKSLTELAISSSLMRLMADGELPLEKYARFKRVPELWYDDPEIGKRACTTVPLYDGLNVETGPRARLDKFQGYKEKGVVAQHLARAREMKTYLSRAIAILDELDTAANTLADFDPRGTNKLGIGVVEAPRGTDIHMAQVKDGKTAFYSALVPTTWNIPTMGPATEGFHHEWGPHVIRAYDPCLSCATHVMVVDDEDGSVVKNEMVRI